LNTCARTPNNLSSPAVAATQPNKARIVTNKACTAVHVATRAYAAAGRPCISTSRSQQEHQQHGQPEARHGGGIRKTAARSNAVVTRAGLSA
jgi:hypothetical protein